MSQQHLSFWLLTFLPSIIILAGISSKHKAEGMMCIHLENESLYWRLSSRMQGMRSRKSDIYISWPCLEINPEAYTNNVAHLKSMILRWEAEYQPWLTLQAADQVLNQRAASSLLATDTGTCHPSPALFPPCTWLTPIYCPFRYLFMRIHPILLSGL